MNVSTQLAKHIRDLHFGGNWTVTNLREILADLSWQEATAKVRDFNTIAMLVFHTHYFVAAVLKVLQGGPLDAHDKYSFDHPPVNSAEEWQQLQDKVFADALAFSELVEQLPENKLNEDFLDGKYGTYYRNIAGIVEHTHYHLGQISLIKKMLREEKR